MILCLGTGLCLSSFLDKHAVLLLRVLEMVKNRQVSIAAFRISDISFPSYEAVGGTSRRSYLMQPLQTQNTQKNRAGTGRPSSYPSREVDRQEPAISACSEGTFVVFHGLELSMFSFSLSNSPNFCLPALLGRISSLQVKHLERASLSFWRISGHARSCFFLFRTALT